MSINFHQSITYIPKCDPCISTAIDHLYFHRLQPKGLEALFELLKIKKRIYMHFIVTKNIISSLNHMLLHIHL